MIKFEDERAFPVTMEDGRGASMTNLGMTLRDYFAAKALQGILVGEKWHEENRGPMAAEAYLFADAMLAERAK